MLRVRSSNCDAGCDATPVSADEILAATTLAPPIKGTSMEQPVLACIRLSLWRQPIHTQEVRGSSPCAPTIRILDLRLADFFTNRFCDVDCDITPLKRSVWAIA